MNRGTGVEMMAIVSAFSLTALGLGTLSLSVAGLWPYYIPVILIAVFLWMHVIDLRNRRVAKRIVRRSPDLLSAEEREVFLCSPSLFIFNRGSQGHVFSGCGLSCVVQAVVVISLVYAVISAFTQAWVPLLLSAGTFLYGLAGPLANAFPTSNPVNNEARAVDRCLIGPHRKDGTGKHVPPHVFEDTRICYWTILNKLYISDSQPLTVLSRRSEGHNASLDSRKGHVSHKDTAIAK
jgi:hypothetical protein